MSKSEIIKRYAETDADRLLLAQISDKIEAATRKNILVTTKFLNEYERSLAEDMLKGYGNPHHMFWGGYEDAGRTVLVLLPNYMGNIDSIDGDIDPLAYINASYPTSSVLSHRDILGTLMGCGIERETVGDILVDTGRCDIIVLRDMLQYILQNVESAGRVKLNLEEIGPDKLHVPEAEFKLIKDTVASLRLDSVVSSGYSLSRDKAAAAIRSGKVFHCHRQCLKPDRHVSEGDTISIRGMGKIALAEIGGITRKGRTAITIKKYI